MAASSVVVVGGGVIGAATSYYLAQRGVRPVVVEAVAPACSASGKAGGFLALDWCDSTALGPLARKSFQLHAELADELGGTGYRRMASHSVSVRAGAGASASGRRGGKSALPGWVDGPGVAQSSVIGSPETTAQVHPELLTRALLRGAEERGGRLVLAAVTGLELDLGGRRVVGVRVRDSGTHDESVLPAGAVVFCMGAWTSKLLQRWLPTCPDVGGLKVHSIVLADEAAATTADALFLTYSGASGGTLEPEVYPRGDGSAYICGVSSETPVPESADLVDVRPEAIATLRQVAAAVSGALAGAPVLREQACYLPTTGDGLPLIGRLPGVEGAFIATGHSCWGILNAPATGLAMAELVVDGEASSVDVAPFDPARLML